VLYFAFSEMDRTACRAKHGSCFSLR
jgi:hypothetical protein